MFLGEKAATLDNSLARSYEGELKEYGFCSTPQRNFLYNPNSIATLSSKMKHCPARQKTSPEKMMSWYDNELQHPTPENVFRTASFIMQETRNIRLACSILLRRQKRIPHRDFVVSDDIGHLLGYPDSSIEHVQNTIHSVFELLLFLHPQEFERITTQLRQTQKSVSPGAIIGAARTQITNLLIDQDALKKAQMYADDVVGVYGNHWNCAGDRSQEREERISLIQHAMESSGMVKIVDETVDKGPFGNFYCRYAEPFGKKESA
jgi:hypothetical protein